MELLYVLWQFMTSPVWAIGVWFTGYTGTYIVKRSLCDKATHEVCGHGPFAFFWPITLPVVAVCMTVAAVLLAPKYAMDQLQARKERNEQKRLELRRNMEWVQSQEERDFNRRTRELELDNDIEPSYDEWGRPIGHEGEEDEHDPEPPESVADAMHALDQQITVEGDNVIVPKELAERIKRNLSVPPAIIQTNESLTKEQADELKRRFFAENLSLPGSLIMGDPPTLNPLPDVTRTQYEQQSTSIVYGTVNLFGVEWLDPSRREWSEMQVQRFIVTAGFLSATNPRITWEYIGANDVAEVNVGVSAYDMRHFHECLDNLRQMEAEKNNRWSHD